MIGTLHDVIESLIDGHEGFQKIGEHLKDETLKKYFLAESLKRSQFRGDLETLLDSTGNHDPEESGCVSGALHRTWGDIKAHLLVAATTLSWRQRSKAKMLPRRPIRKHFKRTCRGRSRTYWPRSTHTSKKSHDYVKTARDSSK
jgi:hypothetical protein